MRRMQRRRMAWILVLAALAVASLGSEYLKRRREADVRATQQLLSALHQAEVRYHQAHGTYARLDTLHEAGESPVREGGRYRGYVYTSVAGSDDYAIVARPLRGEGECYTMNATGVLNLPPVPKAPTPEEALAKARARVQANPRDVRAWLDLVAQLRQMDRTQEALEAARRAARLDRKAAKSLLHETLLDRADALLEARQPQEALRLLRDPAVDTKDPSAQALLGDAYHALGQTNRAVAAYEKAIATQPFLARAWFGLAQIQEARGQRQEAMRSYLRVVDIGANAEIPDEWEQASMEALSRLSKETERKP